jgi:hypothetical protein
MCPRLRADCIQGSADIRVGTTRASTDTQIKRSHRRVAEHQQTNSRKYKEAQAHDDDLQRRIESALRTLREP